MDLNKIKECIGDPEADVENPILKAEQDAQVEFPWPFSSNIFYSYIFLLWCFSP